MLLSLKQMPTAQRGRGRDSDWHSHKTDTPFSMSPCGLCFEGWTFLRGAFVVFSYLPLWLIPWQWGLFGAAASLGCRETSHSDCAMGNNTWCPWSWRHPVQIPVPPLPVGRAYRNGSISQVPLPPPRRVTTALASSVAEAKE